jgi:hypothetical protein
MLFMYSEIITLIIMIGFIIVKVKDNKSSKKPENKDGIMVSTQTSDAEIQKQKKNRQNNTIIGSVLISAASVFTGFAYFRSKKADLAFKQLNLTRS